MHPIGDQFDDAQPARDLEAMPQGHRVAFAASCSERVAPCYRAYALVVGLESLDLVENALGEVWSSLEKGSLPQARAQLLVDALSDVIPKIQGDGFVFTPLASNAVSAMVYTLKCCKDGQAKWSALAARMSVESVDTYLHFVNDVPLSTTTLVPTDPVDVRKQNELFEKWIAEAPLMRDELEMLQRDLNILGTSNVLTVNALEEMRSSSRDRGVQPARRGLIWTPK
jgi:uncharacterized protein YjaG (DUF416 family)